MTTKNLSDLQFLNSELTAAVTNLAPYHAAMEKYCNFYEDSAFFPRKAGQKKQLEVADNYLQIFADMNIHYTSKFPGIKVSGAPQDRKNSDMREKIIYGTWRESGGESLLKDWSRDATKKTVAISEVKFDLKDRCVRVVRHDPRFVYWKLANGSGTKKVSAFWAVFPITAAEAKETYKVVPTHDTVSQSIGAKGDPYFHDMDGQNWFTMAIRWDAKYRVAWIGDKLIEEPHEHGMGVIPVDVCAPFPTEERQRFGAFYLKKLISLQAELNETVRRRSKIVKRLSNPIIWGRGIQSKGYDDVEQALKDGEAGILGLKKDGEVGILQLQELKTIYDHEASLKNSMQRLSGFAAASFGESVGANTSGDALGMYFTPTQKHVEDQQISWKAFFESINAKILHAYDVYGKTNEEFKLDGYAPRSTLSSLGGESKPLPGGNFQVTFTREVINGNYINLVMMPPITPKNEIEEKRLVVEAVDKKFISRHTGHEMWNIQSPDDELELLTMEQANPLLNAGAMDVMNPQQPQGVGSGILPPPPQLTPGA